MHYRKEPAVTGSYLNGFLATQTTVGSHLLDSRSMQLW